MNTSVFLKFCQKRVNLALKKCLPSAQQSPKKLHQAMRYALLNGGKRIRSAYIYATGEALGGDLIVLDQISAAIEIVHAFTLIHDDLPALDNDDLRRGKPSCHIAFDEATAILAGDALHALAFEIIAGLNQKKVPAEIKIKMVLILTKAMGSLGVIGGEELDILMTTNKTSLKQLEFAYRLKTGSLLKACIMLAALASGCKKKNILNHLEQFADEIGLAFQIHDDIIGIQSSTQLLGKPQGSDDLRMKPTYPGLLGMSKAKEKRKIIFNKALIHLNKSGLKTEKLLGLSEFVIDRNY